MLQAGEPGSGEEKVGCKIEGWMGIDRECVRVAATIGKARAVVGQEDNADDGLLVICVEQVSACLLVADRRTDGLAIA